ncbi:MAG: ABC transporter permease [Clostridium sp.]|nr:ABC transporter permease [Clostridium sp.]
MNHLLFIARRLYGHEGDTGHVSRPAVWIATAGMAVGMAVMIVSICVVIGFKREIRSKIIGFGSHIQVMNYNGLYSLTPRPVEVTDSLMQQWGNIPNVKHVQRFAVKPGMLKTENEFKGVQFRGVGPEYDLSFLKHNLTDGMIPVFSDTTPSNQIVLSAMMAQELHLKVGDKVYAYFFENTVRARRFTVSAIYRTNLTEFDNSIVFTDLYTCKRLNGWENHQVSGAEIQLTDFERIDETALLFVKHVNRQTDPHGEPYTSATIMELNRPIFGWLDLLDTNIWMILMLMIGLSGFTMISGLLIIILERTSFIGIMKALGATNTSVRRIFLYFSAFIIGKGMLIGNVIGLGLVGLQAAFGWVSLDPETYYVDTVPVWINPWYILLINAVVLPLSVLMLVLPSFLVSNIHPVKSIRFE